MNTFTVEAATSKWMLTISPFIAQNTKCTLCKEPWRNHFAGESKTIPNGACPDQWKDIADFREISKEILDASNY